MVGHRLYFDNLGDNLGPRPEYPTSASPVVADSNMADPGKPALDRPVRETRRSR